MSSRCTCDAFLSELPTLIASLPLVQPAVGSGLDEARVQKRFHSDLLRLGVYGSGGPLRVGELFNPWKRQARQDAPGVVVEGRSHPRLILTLQVLLQEHHGTG